MPGFGQLPPKPSVRYRRVRTRGNLIIGWRLHGIQATPRPGKRISRHDRRTARELLAVAAVIDAALVEVCPDARPHPARPAAPYPDPTGRPVRRPPAGR
jgi:hypothetical protein